MISVIEDVFDVAGVSVKVSSAQERNICCPFCVERGQSQDTRYRLGINIVSGWGHCFNCNWASRDKSYTVDELCRVFGIKHKFRVKREPVKKKAIKLDPIRLPEEYEHFHFDRNDPVQKRALDYLKARRVTLAQMVRHKIGFAAYGRMGWRILVPVIGPRNEIYGCVGRDFSGVQHPKYLNTPGIKLLWNAYRGGHTAVVVEGLFDALRVEQALLRKPGNWVAVATLGCAITETQLEQLAGFEKVVVMPDADRPGVEAAPDLARLCAEHGMRVSVVVPEILDESDPGEMSESVILDLLGAARPWSEALSLRLRRQARKVEICDM